MRLSLSFPLALALCFSLTGCDKPEDVTETTASPAPAPAVVVEIPPPPPLPVEEASDTVALAEEELDRVLAENSDLSSRASDLESQVNDGKALIALKEKQIRELEEKIKALKQP